MLKYLTKRAMEIFPSVVATILGAYIVNHYIVNRPAADAPAAALSATEAKRVEAKADPKTGAKNDTKIEAKPAEASTDVANIPEPGVKAKGISEKAIFGKPAVDSAYEKAVEKPADGVTVVTEPRRTPTAPREKAVAKTQALPAPVTAVTAPAPVEAAAVPDEHEQHRDAAELARAAIERLRATSG